MATRSHIGIRNDDNTVSYVYCHYDGYPEHNGKILLNHYNNKEIINTLLNNGNMSILGEQIDPSPDSPHTFSGKRQDNVCIFYFRERNETGQEKKTVSGVVEYKMHKSGIDYQYLYENNQWKYRSGKGDFSLLTPQVCKMS